MKPNAYTQFYVQLIFAVKNRDACLNSSIRPRVFEYVSGILTRLKYKSIIVNGVSNHIHIFYGMNPDISVSDTVHDIKRSSSLLINQNRLCRYSFSWQAGYGGFTYSRSQVTNVYNYINNQEMHHKKYSFREEYLAFLKEFEVEYDERYLFYFFD